MSKFIRIGVSAILLGGVALKTDWAEVGAAYRRLLFRTGVVASRPEQGVLEPETARRVVEVEKGVLSVSERLGCRLRFLSSGLVLGSRAFVEAHLGGWWKRGRGGGGSAPGPQGAGAGWFMGWRGRAVPVRGAPG